MTNEPMNRIPVHVSMIMDGNGRWAKERGKERIYGHFEGVESVRACVEAAVETGVKYLSIYAFSEENWNRPQAEVDGLMELMVKAMAAEMEKLILDVKRQGDTVGGVVTCVVKGAPVGLGEPLYGKLTSSLAHAMLSINAAKGFEYGNGFEAAKGRGSQQNDIFRCVSGKVRTVSNNSGGIQGGISNGDDIYFRVAFKPVATLLMEQPTVTSTGEETVLMAKGRHDPCVVPRAVPVVEAMAALVILDNYLLARAGKELFV